MDQIKIGKFIAQQRKAKEMTQMEFAEKLGVSNKSISRWETGKNMPDVSLFIPICELLDISVNELIIGEKITDEITEKEEIRKTNEAIVETIKKSNKTIRTARIIIYIVMVFLNAMLSLIVPITADPADAMAVPLAAVLGGSISVIVISFLNIKPSLKFLILPISAVFIILGSYFYFGSVFDYGLPYAAIIAILQSVIILISMLIRFLIEKIKRNDKK